jgi:hypothetical protein
MSARSLNGGDLTLNNLTITGTLTVENQNNPTNDSLQTNIIESTDSTNSINMNDNGNIDFTGNVIVSNMTSDNVIITDLTVSNNMTAVSIQTNLIESTDSTNSINMNDNGNIDFTGNVIVSNMTSDNVIITDLTVSNNMTSDNATIDNLSVSGSVFNLSNVGNTTINATSSNLNVESSGNITFIANNNSNLFVANNGLYFQNNGGVYMPGANGIPIALQPTQLYLSNYGNWVFSQNTAYYSYNMILIYNVATTTNQYVILDTAQYQNISLTVINQSTTSSIYLQNTSGFNFFGEKNDTVQYSLSPGGGAGNLTTLLCVAGLWYVTNFYNSA